MKKTNSLTLALIFACAAYLTGAQAQDQGGFHEAMSSCLTELGLSRPEKGQRPNEEDRAKVSACLESKGFTKPKGRHGKGKNREAFKACIAELGIAKPEKGQRPSDEDRSKIKACVASKKS